MPCGGSRGSSSGASIAPACAGATGSVGSEITLKGIMYRRAGWEPSGILSLDRSRQHDEALDDDDEQEHQQRERSQRERPYEPARGAKAHPDELPRHEHEKEEPEND